MKLRTLPLLLGLAALPLFAEDLSIVHQKQSVTLDGRGDDPAWQTATVLDNALLKLGTDGKKPVGATNVRVFQNGKSLYLLFDCAEPDAAKLRATQTRRDGSLYLDDCVEVFLSSQGNGEPYYHFMVNPAGVVYDARVANERVTPSWDGKWQAAATRNDRGYTVEMELPFAMFERPNSTTWRMLLARENKVQNELSCFPLIQEKTFHMPGRFVNLNGLEPDADCFPFAPESCTFRFDSNRNGVIQGFFDLALQSNLALDKSKLLVKLAGRSGGKTTLKFGKGELPAGNVKLSAKASLFDGGDYKADLYYNGALIGSWSCPVSMAEFNAELLYPRYRNYIFDSMKLKALTVELAPAVASAAGKQGTATLLAADGAAIGTPTEFTLGKEAKMVSLPLPESLPLGKYALAITLGGQTQKLPVEKVKTPPGMPEVWFDESNNMVVNGKKVFPFGIFYAAPERDGFHASGFNLLGDVLPYRFNEYDDTPDTLLFANARSFTESTYSRKEVPQSELNLFRQRNAAALPQVVGWFVADEPGLRVKDVAAYRKSLQQMKEISPLRPLWGCHNTVGALLDLDIDLMDIISLDCYLGFERGKSHPTIPYSRLCTYFDTASKASKMRKPLWSVVESFSVGNYHQQPKNSRFPTIAEHRMLVYLSIINGARGIVFWRDTQLSTPGVWKSLKAFAEEIRVMEPFLLAPDTHAKIVDGSVNILRRDADGASCFIVANAGGEARTVTLETGFNGTMHFLAEDRAIESKDGKATLNLAPYALHILWTKPVPELRMARILCEYKESDSHIGRPMDGNVAGYWRGAEPFFSSRNIWTFAWGGCDENFTEEWLSAATDAAPFYGVKFAAPETVKRVSVIAPRCPERVELTGTGGSKFRDKADAKLSYLHYDDATDAYVATAEKPKTQNNIYQCWSWTMDEPAVTSVKVHAKNLIELMVFNQ